MVCNYLKEINVKFLNLNNKDLGKWLAWITCLALMLLAGEALASGGGAGASKTLGDMASNITKSFENVARLITAGSYIAGLGFSIGAIMKFKQHKDNPSQIPLGTPIALVFIGAALLFLPSILGVAGQTMFDQKGTVAGPKGTVFE